MTKHDKFKQQQYAVLNNVIPEHMCEFLTKYIVLKSKTNTMVRDPQCPLSLASYGDPVFDTLLADLTGYFSEQVGEELLPTYSYHRLYRKGDVLKIHRDRPSCEVSATISLGVDDPEKISPIYVNTEEPVDENDGTLIQLGVGDAVLYEGMTLWHWRKTIENTWFTQVFLHYVRKNGPYADLLFDGRKTLGIPNDE